MFGLIGTGNMGSALARALCRGVGPERLLLCNRTEEKARALARELGCAVGDSQTLAGSCRYLLLGVKPQGMAALLAELRPILQSSRPVLVSMAAGLTLEQLEALADGAVACGIPRDKALRFAAAAVAGAARLALESGSHPGVLKDSVCSPGGSTIQGVRLLENRAFRGAAMDAVITAAGASGDLGRR